MSARRATDASVRHAIGDGGSRLTANVCELLDTLRSANAPATQLAAETLLATIERGGLVHVAGTGHGTILVLETFYRAGGLACIAPIWAPSLLPLGGARRSTEAERTVGLGMTIADESGIRAGDTVIVASQSGVNPVPIELAARSREVGASVIAVVSLAHSSSVPSRDALGRRLADVADIVIDTHVLPGDAVLSIGSGVPPVAAVSTMAIVHAWNLVLVRLAELARDAGRGLPVWVSSNVPGGDARNAELIARYAARIGAL